MAENADPLTQLNAGFLVPEYGTFVPWLIAKDEMFRLIPEAAFAASPGGWPMLRFTLLGVTAVFGFNFVTHPDSKLIEVQFKNDDAASWERTFWDSAARLRDRLGTPNDADDPELRDLRWYDGRVWVHNLIETGLDLLNCRDVTSHILSVYAVFGMRDALTG